MSTWIVILDALEPFMVNGPKQDPPVLPYLRYKDAVNYDILLNVLLAPEGQQPHGIYRSNFKYMYWNVLQQLAHQIVSGGNINIGDMYASGTISGATPGSFGPMLELS